MGCEQAQGYLWSRPLPPKELETSFERLWPRLQPVWPYWESQWAQDWPTLDRASSTTLPAYSNSQGLKSERIACQHLQPFRRFHPRQIGQDLRAVLRWER